MPDLGSIIDGHTVRFERLFPLAAEDLWAYLTSRDGLSRWLADGHIGPDRAELRFADNGSAIEGEVTTWEPPRLVEFDWTGGPTQADGSRVRFKVVAEGASASRLILTHSDVTAPAGPDFAAGWHRHVDTLSAFANGTPHSPEGPSWQELYEIYCRVNTVGG
jgi:uncharacterized protein YndB with AHSA1/START domain